MRHLLIACGASALLVASGVAQQPATVRDLHAGEFDAMLHGVEKNSATGFSVAVGDVNGDGVADVILGAIGTDSLLKGKINDTGSVSVYFGRKELAKTIDLSRQADLVLYGGNRGDQVGFAVAVADVNGDGIKDVVAGAPPADGRLGKKSNNAGITYVYFGRTAFPQKQVGLDAGADVELHSSISHEYSGSALAAGDVNGDGVDDLLIGAPFGDAPVNDAGTVYVVCGSKTLAGKLPLAQTACATVRGLNAGDRLGSGLAAGDVSGDGIADIVAGALEADAPGADNSGQVVVLPGRKDLARQLDLRRDALFRFTGGAGSDFVGQALSVGDVNGDGSADLVIGVPYADLTATAEKNDVKNETDAGKVVVLYGGSGLRGDRSLKDGRDVVLSGSQGGTLYGDFTGGTIATGDLNGDGTADLVMGAPLADLQDRTRPDPDQMKDVGAVLVRYGAGDLPGNIALPSGADLVIYGATPNDFFGGVALTKRRKSDGFGGLLNPNSYRKAWMTTVYDRFFSKAIAVGDVNGDGVGDLVAAGPAADGPGTQTQKIDDVGAVFVVLGKRQ